MGLSNVMTSLRTATTKLPTQAHHPPTPLCGRLEWDFSKWTQFSGRRRQWWPGSAYCPSRQPQSGRKVHWLGDWSMQREVSSTVAWLPISRHHSRVSRFFVPTWPIQGFLLTDTPNIYNEARCPRARVHAAPPTYAADPSLEKEKEKAFVIHQRLASDYEQAHPD
ncbi:hypothetical protein LZ30DRAFT_265705 [Colletotrichum cereale]|nr:hypothetical protein LZ30DRAFT_265705 [Colletotrichum cereale]